VDRGGQSLDDDLDSRGAVLKGLAEVAPHDATQEDVTDEPFIEHADFTVEDERACPKAYPGEALEALESIGREFDDVLILDVLGVIEMNGDKSLFYLRRYEHVRGGS